MRRDIQKTGWLVSMHGLKVLQAALLRPSCLLLCYAFMQLNGN